MQTATETGLGRLPCGAGQLLGALGESLSSLTGRELGVDPAGDEAREGFGQRPVYLFRISAGEERIALLALELEVAVLAGGALAMTDEETQKQVCESREVPPELHQSIGEAARLLAAAVGKACGLEVRVGDDFELATPGAWPAVLTAGGGGEDWAAAVGIVTEGEDRLGAVLLAAAPGGAEAGAEPEPQGERTYEHLLVQITGPPADPSQVALAEVVRACGARLVPLYSEPEPGERPDVLLVVSRSPSDLATRLRKLASTPAPPRMVVACSDRPTRDLVVEAKANGAGDFLVLPPPRERLAALFARVSGDGGS